MTRRLRVFRSWSVLVLCGAFLVGASAAADAQVNGISPSASSQISALLQEKESRTPAQRKIDSNLLYTLRMSRNQPVAPGISTLETGIDVLAGNRVVVDIVCAVNDSLLQRLEDLGARVIDYQMGSRNIRAEVSLGDLETIAERADVTFIHRKQEATTVGNAAAMPGLLRSVHPSLISKLKPGFAVRAAALRSKVEAALRVRAALKPKAVATVNVSEGRVTHRANQVVSSFGVVGAGVKVGVLSDGVSSLASIQASNDLGTVTVLPGQAGSGDEGTAMLEIVHDLAPGAQLYFATAFTSISSFAQNIRDLRTAGCDIIVDDVFYFVETPFQKGQAASVASTTNGGLVSEAVNVVTAAGALYFSSAGNSGNLNDATSGTWEGDFSDGGAVAPPIPVAETGNYHQFVSGQNYDVLTVFSGNPTNFYWSDPLGGSANDYDLFILNSAGTAVTASSTNIQNGTQDPYEIVSGPAANARIVIVKRPSAAARFLHLSTNRARLSISTQGETHGHSATPSPFAFTVAATPASNFAGPPNPVGPYPGPFNSSNLVELFSSDGPRRVFFNRDSTAITPGNFSSTGGELLQKPDITAADGVSCAAPGFNPFFGTSAAAPHAAAIAALVKSAVPAQTQTQISTALTSTAIDIEAAGVDRDSGVGILDALSAVTSTGVTPQAVLILGTTTAAELTGNGNGFVEPGECGALTVQLTNGNASIAATAISATLSTSTPGVTINVANSAYPDIPGGGSAVNTTPFQFSLANTVSCPLSVQFTLTVTFSGGTSPQVLVFSLRTGAPPAAASTTLDATAPPSVSGVYSAATGTQTGRLTRIAPTSACGVLKSNPGLTALTGARQYDAYTFTNCSSGTACVVVNMTQTGGTSGALFTAAYSSSFDPSNPATNYLADPGQSFATGAPASYSFNIASGATFVVVVHEVNIGAGVGSTYTLSVDGMCLPCATYTGSGCGVTCPTITLSPASLPAGTVGTPYSQVVTPSGGVAPYTFNVTGLPPGLTPTPSATSVTISGTPTGPSSGTVTVSGTDSNGCPFSKNYSLSVVCPPPPAVPITAAATVRPASTGNAASVPDAGAGATYVWTIAGGTITGGAGTRSITFTAFASGSVVLNVTVTSSNTCTATGFKAVEILVGEFNGDGNADILLRNTSTGSDAVWVMNGTTVTSAVLLTPISDTTWRIVGTGDFNADGSADILWRRDSGDNGIWLMNGTTKTGTVGLPLVTDPLWKIVGTGEFNGDGKVDILWRRDSGENVVWLMNGSTFGSVVFLPIVTDPLWKIVGTGDFSGDGKVDILWRRDTGEIAVWTMNGTVITGVVSLPLVTDPAWKIVATGDYNGDGAVDIVWRRDTGEDAVWLMNGTTLGSIASLPLMTDPAWKIVGPK